MGRKRDAFVVTSTYVNLGIPGVHGEGSSHLSIKKEDFVDDDLNLFQKIWDKKYENAPISFVHPFSMENEVVIGCDMCFEECPVPGTYLYAAYQDGQWYFIKTEWRQEGYTSQDYYHGYPVNDPEILEFLNAYAEGYITSE